MPLGRPKTCELLDQTEEFQRLRETGSVNQADVSRRNGMSRARVTQILNLRKLHPAITSFIRASADDGVRPPPSERGLRHLTSMSAEDQLSAADLDVAGFSEYLACVRTPASEVVGGVV